VSVRWRPLLSARSDKSLTQSFHVLRSSKWRPSSWRFRFCGRRCFPAVSHPQQYSIATRDTVVPMNIEVPTKYQLSHNDRIVVLAIRLHSESPMLYKQITEPKESRHLTSYVAEERRMGVIRWQKTGWNLVIFFWTPLGLCGRFTMSELIRTHKAGLLWIWNPQTSEKRWTDRLSN